MLDVLRDNAQSWIVKVLFAVIVIVFVFWGVGSFTGDREGILAVVNDKPIKINDYIRAYENAANAIRQQNPEVTAADLRQMQLKQQIFNDLLNSQLLVEKARELGLIVTSRELQREITRIPAFLSEDQRFDPQRYEGVLRSHQLTPAQFERDFQQNLLLEKMEDYISMPARPNEQEVAEFFNYIRSQVKIDYLKVSWEDFRDEADPSDEEIMAYYKENRSRFMLPEQISVSYLKLTPRALASLQDVTVEEMESYYQAHQSDFSQDERVSARHILLMVDENAPEEEVNKIRKKIEEIKKDIDEGASFEDLAGEYSDCPSADQGGDLGSFGRGQMVPEFEEAAFDTSPGEISGPVKTQFGWHLIKVEDYIPAGTRDFDEVRARIRMNVGEEKALDQIADIMDDVLEVIITGGDLSQAADRLNLEIRETDYFSRDEGPRDLTLSDAAINTLFSMVIGEVTEMPIMVEDGYIFAEKTGARESTVKDLEEEVAEEIKNTLIRQKAMTMAGEKAEEYLAIVQDFEISDEIESMLKTSQPFDRQGFIPGLGESPELATRAFAASEGTWLENVYSLGNGYVVARVAEHTRPSQEEYLRQKDQWMSSYAEMQKQQAFQAFINMLRNQARIKIFRPDIIEG
jgi:peptidyl-prolyl cis-trans isomerase D